MLQPILTLPSGTELKGGSPGSAVKSLTLHTAVNAGQEFAIGSAFSDYIEAEIWADPGGSLQITAGDALTYYRQDDAGNRTKVGIFYAEKPTHTKRNSYKVTAVQAGCRLFRLAAGQSGAVPQDHLAAGTAGLPAGRGYACQQQPAHQRQLQRAGVLCG